MKLSDDTVSFKGTRESAWNKLVDWQRMHEWDLFMESVQFDGALKLGSVGKLKMKNGPAVDLRVTAFEAGHSYSDEFELMWSRFIFHHDVTESTEGLVSVRVQVEGHGVLAWLAAGYLRQSFAANMPILMRNFKDQYEEENRVAPL
ncbi:MAG: hypothetical protein K2W95_19140 [Candidatus Obscuribacterales bacterium]|nr:hypothetical protein [Candidatus Obscuribacterales bacterium]